MPEKEQAKKDTYKYELHNGHKTVYVGITKDPERRESEHRADEYAIIERPSTAEGAGSESTLTSAIMVVTGLSTIRMIPANKTYRSN